MFVRDFIHVDQPFGEVAPRFVRDASWLTPIAEEAVRAAYEVGTRMLDSAAPERAVVEPAGVKIGPVRARAASILIPLWLLTATPHLGLPDLAGDLEVAPVGAHRCLVAFEATYRRPSREPEVLARVERATEAGIRTFLTGIAAALSHRLPTV